MFYLTTHSTHFIYGCMVSDIWLRTILVKKTKNVVKIMGPKQGTLIALERDVAPW